MMIFYYFFLYFLLFVKRGKTTMPESHSNVLIWENLDIAERLYACMK